MDHTSLFDLVTLYITINLKQPWPDCITNLGFLVTVTTIPCRIKPLSPAWVAGFLLLHTTWQIIKCIKACWLYNKAKITLHVHKFPLRIVNDKVMLVIEHPNLFNPVFKIYLKSSNMRRPVDNGTTHAQNLNAVRTYEQTVRAHKYVRSTLG